MSFSVISLVWLITFCGIIRNIDIMCTDKRVCTVSTAYDDGETTIIGDHEKLHRERCLSLLQESVRIAKMKLVINLVLNIVTLTIGFIAYKYLQKLHRYLEALMLDIVTTFSHWVTENLGVDFHEATGLDTKYLKEKGWDHDAMKLELFSKISDLLTPYILDRRLRIQDHGDWEDMDGIERDEIWEYYWPYYGIINLNFKIVNPDFLSHMFPRDVDHPEDERRGFVPELENIPKRLSVKQILLNSMHQWINFYTEITRSYIRVWPTRNVYGQQMQYENATTEEDIYINWRSVEELTSVCEMNRKDYENYLTMKSYAASPNLNFPLVFKDFHFALAVICYNLTHRKTTRSSQIFSDKNEQLKD